MSRDRDGHIVENKKWLDPDRDLWQEMSHVNRIWYFDDPELRMITETTYRKAQYYESD